MLYVNYDGTIQLTRGDTARFNLTIKNKCVSNRLPDSTGRYIDNVHQEICKRRRSCRTNQH